MLAVAAIALLGAALPERYAAGQLWQYRTRPRDAGSLLKIQQVEAFGNGRVYHLSIAGVHYGGASEAGVLAHIPVSDTTLDASVLRLAPASTVFPAADVQAGIDEWRRANGGVFTIPVAEIVTMIDQTLEGGRPEASRPPG